MIPDENLVFDPEGLIQEVVAETHYFPSSWRENPNAQFVRSEFGALFEYKFVHYIQEVISLLTAPLVLCYSLPPRAEQIVDFFREFTVFEEGLGYVCSFAVFDFKRHGNAKVTTYYYIVVFLFSFSFL